MDPNVFEPVEPAFAAINRIEPAQQAFFSRVVGRMQTQPYEEWTHLWVQPEDATLVEFSSTSSDTWSLLPIFFFSPTRPNQWQQLGVTMPW